MDGLRWLLLISGIVVVVGIYFYGRMKASGPSVDTGGSRVEPQLSADDDVESFTDSAPAETEDFVEIEEEPMLVDDDDEPAAEPSPQKIVTLRIVARERGSFRGDDLILSLRGIGMRHGKFGIFHRIDGDDDEATIFSAASLVEPGSFDLENIKEQSIPGISLFLVLPGPLEGAEAFDMMIESARTITQALNGELLDESGSTLSIQRERYMREEVIQFEHDNHAA
ncbi:MAG: cell division protein ZipA [Woeseiaceae bacterium]|nr:cell division protein ZipA [Woeseiaceae bacterium]